MSSPTRRLARPLLASIFIASGISALREPDFIVAQTRAAGLAEPELLAKVHGITNLAGGLALATGRLPRLASLGLALGLIPTTIVGHPFWAAEAEQKQMQQINFLKNASMLGGLLIAAVDNGGRTSLGQKVGRASGRATRKAEVAAATAGKRAAKVSSAASSKTSQVGTTVSKKAGRAGRKFSPS